MPDMLVSLLDLPPLSPLVDELREQKIAIRHAYPFEISAVLGAVEKLFFGSRAHADEVSVCFANKPISVYIAIDQSVEKSHIVGFAAYECKCRNFFGPMAVAESHQRRGIGKALLIACLHALRDMGYVYGIIGSAAAAAVDFYKKVCGAMIIEGSDPGYGYRDLLWGFA